MIKQQLKSFFDPQFRSRLRGVGLLALVIVALDHLTKWWIVQNVALGQVNPVIHGFFDIVHTRNRGAAFGMLHNWDSPLRDYFFYLVGFVAFVFLLQFLKSLTPQDKWSRWAVGLILGGALGNLIDRAVRGSVVDFISWHYHDQIAQWQIFGHELVVPLTWPAFNVADSAISVAIVVLIVQSFRQELKSEPKP